ncbi:MAG: long-chain-acyl-CoA synthetase [Caulobacteraceae bacterium]
MGVWSRAARELRFLGGLVRTLKRVRSVTPDSPTLTCDDLEAAVDKFAERTAIVFEGRSVTYGELDALANRYASWAKGRGIIRGETVALFMPNRIEYLAVWYGLSKVGVVTALINNQLSGAALAHCLNVCAAAHLISDTETTAAVQAIRTQLTRSITEWVVGGGGHAGDRDLDQALKGASSLRPTRATAREGITAKDVALYIFTSGTTGLPKAAKVTHMRAQLYMRGFVAATNAKPTDRIYNALPLYHATGGLCAVGAALLGGGAVVLKRRFSASQFWGDIVDNDCTMFVYIGEFCRYLVNQPEQPGETRHKLRLIFGNGLRPDVWAQMEQRFKIPMVLEFYGATEGNVSILNFDGKLGAIGRIPKYLRSRFNVRLVKFDQETQAPVRGSNGLLIECQPDEVGECIGKIAADARSSFVGYADKAATNKKVLHDVFKPGDMWFRTGDLMRQDREGYLYFVDRVGDTFRWKGENVSTTEVESRLSEIPGVEEANVYGVPVPNTEGKAGMAALVTSPDFDVSGLQAAVDAALPAYARPAFVRLSPKVAVTGTFKHTKVEATAEGFDPTRVGDLMFYRSAHGYATLDADAYRRICSGEIRL